MNKLGLAVVATLLALCFASSPARAAVISVGPYTASTTMPFVVPIRITGAIDLTSWTFDLAFDASDLTINTACDPFTDPFCSLLTGPVTEGSFFSGVAMFPTLFVPGFILLDTSLAQTGRLLGVYGAWQDPLPGVSGDGVLAYVEFVARPGARGDSPITIGAQPTAVPEPAPIALLIVGFTLLILRRRDRARTSPDSSTRRTRPRMPCLAIDVSAFLRRDLRTARASCAKLGHVNASPRSP